MGGRLRDEAGEAESRTSRLTMASGFEAVSSRRHHGERATLKSRQPLHLAPTRPRAAMFFFSSARGGGGARRGGGQGSGTGGAVTPSAGGMRRPAVRRTAWERPKPPRDGVSDGRCFRVEGGGGGGVERRNVTSFLAGAGRQREGHATSWPRETGGARGALDGGGGAGRRGHAPCASYDSGGQPRGGETPGSRARRGAPGRRGGVSACAWRGPFDDGGGGAGF